MDTIFYVLMTAIYGMVMFLIIGGVLYLMITTFTKWWTKQQTDYITEDPPKKEEQDWDTTNIPF